MRRHSLFTALLPSATAGFFVILLIALLVQSVNRVSEQEEVLADRLSSIDALQRTVDDLVAVAAVQRDVLSEAGLLDELTRRADEVGVSLALDGAATEDGSGDGAPGSTVLDLGVTLPALGTGLPEVIDVTDATETPVAVPSVTVPPTTIPADAVPDTPAVTTTVPDVPVTTTLPDAPPAPDGAESPTTTAPPVTVPVTVPGTGL